MSDTFRQLDDLIERRVIHSVFFGQSATKTHKRFATLRTGMGETVATGEGQTGEEALRDALAKLTRQPAVTTMPAMPGMTRPAAMPGMGG